MSSCEDSNINKSYIIQSIDSVDIFSACTEIFLTNITPCAGDTININSNLNVSGNISGTTYFGDGSQLSGILTTDNFVTGGVYSASSETLYFTGTTGFTPFSVDVSALLDNTNNFVTGGTYNPSTDIVTLRRNDNVNINITGVSNTFTTGATYNEGTELITFVRNDGNSFTTDLSSVVTATTNSFTTGATLNGNIIEFANNLLGLDYYNVDLTPIVSGKVEISLFNTYTGNTQTELDGKLDTTSFNTYTGDTKTELDSKTENTDFVSHTGDTTIHYTKDSINLSDLGSSAHTHSISEVINLQTELDAKVSTTLFDTYTGDTATSLNGKLDMTSFNTYSGSVQTELDAKVEATLFNTYTGDTQTELGNKLATTTFNSYTGSVVDVHVSSGNANASTQQLSLTNTTGGTFNVTNSAALFSDNDINVTGGTYDTNTGCVTFVTNSGTTFDVCGFVTGITDTFVTGGTLTGDNLILERSSGINVSDINLSGLVSGKLEISLFNTYTGDTQTSLGNKTENTDFVSHTGDTTIHYTKGSINLSELGSSAHTHSISEVVNLQTELDAKVEATLFNTYTGDTQTQLDSKVESASNVGGANEVFSGKSGTDLKFRTISGGSNTTITTVGGIIKIDASGGGSGEVNTASNVGVGIDFFKQKNGVDLEFRTLSGGTYTQLIEGTSTNVINITGLTSDSDFTSHTGNTTIHYTKDNINLSDLGSSAHTHSISEVVNLQTELDAKLATTLFNTYTGDTQTQLDSKLATTTFNSYTGSVVDVHISSGNANAGTQQLSFTNTTGGTFNVTNSAALFSDNDVNVTGGTYDINNGCVTFVTNSGTTFDVCGFVTGITDTFVSGGTLSGTDLVLKRNSGVNVGNIDLSGLVSDKLEISLFNTYTGDTQTALGNKLDITSFNAYSGSVNTQINNKVETTLFNTYTGDTQTILNGKLDTTTFNTYSGSVQTELNNKTENTNFTSHTGDTTIHYTKGSINLSELGSSAHTHSISEVVNLQTELDGKLDTTSFNTYTGDTKTELDGKLDTSVFNVYSGSVQTELDSKIESASNVGGAIEVFSGKSGTDLKFRTISGGTNTSVSLSGDTIVINSTGGGSGEVNTASNLGVGTGLFAQKDGVDLEFKSVTSTGGTVTITNDSTTVNIESAGGSTGVSDANKIFSWFMNVS